MVDHQTPQKFGRHIIVGMDDTISSTNNRFGVGEYNRWVVLHQLIDCFSHNLHITLDSSLTKDVRLEFSENLFAFKETIPPPRRRSARRAGISDCIHP